MKLYNIYNKINQSKVGRSVCGFLIAWIVLYVFLCFSNVTQFYYDSYGYWDLSKTFWSDGGFVFKPQNFSLRAYSWPLILALLNGIGKFGLYGYWMLLGAFYSLFITVGLADLFELLFDKRITFFRRIIPVLLILLFWPGLITYPLSDVAAVLMSVIAVYFLVLLMKNRTRLGKWGGYCLLYGVMAGIFSDLALNIRATYKYNIYIGILFLLMLYIERHKIAYKKLFCSLLGFLVGLLLIALPQVYCNYVNYNKISIDNPLTYLSSTGDRTGYLLYEGAIMPRRETYVGTDASITPGFETVDPVVEAIFQKEGLSLGVVDGLGLGVIDYIKFVLRYPVEFAGVYLCHFINCFDVRYGEIYISDFGGRYFIQFLSILLYLAVLIDVCLCYSQKRKKGIPFSNILKIERLFTLFYILLPALISLPGHIEPRYAIAGHILIYVYLAFLCKVGRLMHWIKRHIVLFLFTFCLIFSLFTLIQNYSLEFAGYQGLIF